MNIEFGKIRRRIPGNVISAVLLFFAVTAAGDRLDVGITVEYSTVLRFESINASIRITNNSGIPFVIGSEEKSGGPVIRLEVDKKQHESSMMLRKEYGVRNLVVDPGDSEAVVCDIGLWYDFTVEGKYLVTAVVYWMGQRYISNCVVVNVVPGIEIAKTTKSLVGHPDHIRKYSLRYWVRNKTEHLFLSIDDENEKVNYGVFRLGKIVRVFQPTLEVNPGGSVTVIHQSGKDMYTRSVLASTTNQVALIDQTYHLKNGNLRPTDLKSPHR
ncbi:MAG: hypothetical protein JXN60_05150 [Lentisphaerae bacterium]|nr:hypothetical protein [Lentisphaerota bacterium]